MLQSFLEKDIPVQCFFKDLSSSILYENFCMIIVLITKEINITFVDTYHYAKQQLDNFVIACGPALGNM